jgi:hypothetical protein
MHIEFRLSWQARNFTRGLWNEADEDFACQQTSSRREARVTTRHANKVRRLHFA